MANYYDILGVPRNASDKDLKDAFKKKAMQYHPDRGGSEEQFKKLNEAYDVLKDPENQHKSTNPDNITSNIKLALGDSRDARWGTLFVRQVTK